jgi:hypothetical protein
MNNYFFIIYIISILIILVITNLLIKKIVENDILFAILRLIFLLLFISYITIYIYFVISKNIYNLNYYNLKFKKWILILIIVIFFMCIGLEFINSNSSVITTIIKPFSDFFGYILIEKYINNLFNSNNKYNFNTDKFIFNPENKIKIYNNWASEINKIKRRFNFKDFDLLNNEKYHYFNKGDTDDIVPGILHEFKLENINKTLEINNMKREFINALNIKEDTGYAIWIIIIIILLQYI